MVGESHIGFSQEVFRIFKLAKYIESGLNLK